MNNKIHLIQDYKYFLSMSLVKTAVLESGHFGFDCRF